MEHASLRKSEGRKEAKGKEGEPIQEEYVSKLSSLGTPRSNGSIFSKKLYEWLNVRIVCPTTLDSFGAQCFASQSTWLHHHK